MSSAIRMFRLSELRVFGKFLVLVLVLTVNLSLINPPTTLGHVPILPGSNETLATATTIPDHTKSWAIYGELHEGGEAQYYRFFASLGQEIHLELLKSTSPEDDEFKPSLVLIGPEIASRGQLPSYIEVPENTGALVLVGKEPAEAVYEGFAPSSFYPLGRLSLQVASSGMFYVAVFEEMRGGHYGLAIGTREDFTISEWITTPITFIAIYEWQGQNMLSIFAPAVGTVVVGIVAVAWRKRTARTTLALAQWVGLLGGLLFFATGVTVFSQMLLSLSRAPGGPDVGITALFIAMPFLLGIVTIRGVLRIGGRLAPRTRILLVALGLVALFVWAGFLVGPILSIVAGLLPSRRM